MCHLIGPSPERALRLNTLYCERVQDRAYARARDAAADPDEAHAHRTAVDPETGWPEIVPLSWVIPKR